MQVGIGPHRTFFGAGFVHIPLYLDTIVMNQSVIYTYYQLCYRLTSGRGSNGHVALHNVLEAKFANR